MSLKPEQALVSVGFDKNGEAEFAISMKLEELSLERMNELRTMLVVAIGTAEDIWRRQWHREIAKQQAKTP